MTSRPVPGKPQDSRALGVWMCVALIVGNVIGMGIFVLPASLAPYGLNALTGWLVTVIGCSFIAICFAGLGRVFPGDDGPYEYIQRAFGDGIAFAVMWCYWVSTWVTNVTIAVGVVAYLTVFVPSLTAIVWLPPVIAVSLLWFFVIVNLRGARVAGWAQVLTAALKLLPLLGVICLGLWVLLTHPAAYVQSLPPNPASFGEVSSVSTLALFAMLGIECATIPACRVCDPENSIPRATVIGTVVTAVIYVCVSIVPMLLIPQHTLAASNAPVADLFASVLGAHAGEVVALFVIISGLGALNGWTLLIGEVTQGIARHGHFPLVLARENGRGAPTGALVVSGAISSVMLLSNYAQSIGSLFTFLSVVVTAANLPLYFACSLAIIALWRRGSKFETSLGPLKPSRAALWVTAAACAALYCLWVSIGIGLKPLLWTLALSAACAPVYWASSYFRRRLAGVAS